MQTVDVQVAVDLDSVPSVEQFEAWVDLVLQHEKISGEVCIRIADEVEIQNLNKQFRSKDKPTNVLSFPSDLPVFEQENKFLGDIIICAQVVLDEASAQNKDPQSHFAHMTIHGVLHLLGFDHIEEIEAEKMESLEAKLLQQLNVSNPYA